MACCSDAKLYASSYLLKNWKPGYFNLSEDHVVLAHHMIRFYGFQSDIMLRGFPNINDNWSTRKSLAAIRCVKIDMLKDAYRGMYQCLHFRDDWEEEDGIEWGKEYLDDTWTSQPTANHRNFFEDVEDAFNRRWKEALTPGKWLTFDKSRFSGWYNSPITMVLEPKPIIKGSIMH